MPFMKVNSMKGGSSNSQRLPVSANGTTDVINTTT